MMRCEAALASGLAPLAGGGAARRPPGTAVRRFPPPPVARRGRCRASRSWWRASRSSPSSCPPVRRWASRPRMRSSVPDGGSVASSVPVALADPVLPGPGGDFDAVAGGELALHVAEMGLDRGQGDVEVCGHFLVGAATRDAAYDVQFALGQRLDQRVRPAAARVAVRPGL